MTNGYTTLVDTYASSRTTLGADMRPGESLVPLEPVPPPGEQARCEETRLRRRMLYGLARDDFRRKVRQRLRSIERSDVWGEPDMTGCLFSTECRSLAQLYTPEAPRVGGKKATPEGPLGPLPPGGSVVAEALDAGGLWALMIRGQRDTIGMREWLVRVSAVEDPAAILGWSLAFRPVYADRVVAMPRRDAPDLPGYIAEAVLLCLEADTCPRWYWEVHDIRGAVPYYEIRTSLEVGGIAVYRVEGDAYPYWDRTTDPPRAILPYSLYHAERTGYLWDPYEWTEAVEGSLELVCLLTFYDHAILKAAWPQRYSIGVDWGGNQTEDDANHDGTTRPRQSIAADPALVLLGYASETGEGTSPPVVGQWQPGADPKLLIESIMVYERRVRAVMGSGSPDVTRESADPRSGYALAVDNSKQNEVRDRYRPAFERGDLETIRVSAAVLGSAAGVVLPTSGYGIEYGPIEPIEPPEVEDGDGRDGRDPGGSEGADQDPGSGEG